MSMQTLRRRASALAAVLGLGVVLPFTIGATPASAQPRISVTKTHEGNFTRGGQGIYHITVRNTGNEPTLGLVRITDLYPQGLTEAQLNVQANDVIPTPGQGCTSSETGILCDWRLDTISTVTIDVTLDVAPDAPCGVATNTVTASELEDGILTSASDAVTITGSGCPSGDGGGGGGGGGSILPINLSGVVTLFNNISTNNNILSPEGKNTTNQNLGINAP
ncbi:hypothetical protein ACFWBN_18095 [Streptomyces sp. NPDC059989]|uniref:hypothetical protein n=1 Tax=Streptomyces sp. NPDC059989 TaxID=3347026 RepID=UPI003678C314